MGAISTIAMAAVTAGAGAVVGTAALVATPGTARADWIDCQDNQLCLWDDSNYAGRSMFVSQGDGRPLFKSNIGSAMNDRVTSIWNRTDWKVCFYRDINYFGQLLCLNPGGSTPNVGSAANDRISSFQPV